MKPTAKTFLTNRRGENIKKVFFSITIKINIQPVHNYITSHSCAYTSCSV